LTTKSLLLLATVLWPLLAVSIEVSSPDGRIVFSVAVNQNGEPGYSIRHGEESIIGSSQLGLRFQDHAALEASLRAAGVERRSVDSSWEQPWGERRQVRDHYNELIVIDELTEFRVPLDANRDCAATIYRNGDAADWKTNPYDYAIDERVVSRANTLELQLAAGGGTAIRFRPTPEAGQ